MERLLGDGDRYRQLLDAAPDAMLVVRDGARIVMVNVQAEKLFGYSRAELLDSPLDVVIPERFRVVHASHVARYAAHPKVRQMGSGMELFGRHKSGVEIPVEVSLSPLRTESGLWIVAAVRDITERKRTEAAAKLAADRLESALESIQDAFAIFDAQDVLAQCNSAYRRFVGEVLPGPLVGRKYADILEAIVRTLALEGEEREHFRAERLRERDDPSGAHDLRTSDGRKYRVSSRRTVEGGIVETLWDLTEDAQREEELRRARVAAEAGSAAKTEFLSSMSHELRTPLNAILGFAQLLERDKKERLSERQHGRVEQILKGGEHLLRLIDDILDLARIESGAVSISTEPVDVADAIREAMRTLEPAAARAQVRLELGAVPDDLPMIAADRTRIIQVLMNYGSNAIKYNHTGGSVEFEVSLAADAMVRVTVRDTGIGIAPDKHDKMFQPFQRAGQETGPIEGTGIGLAITKRLAELMGGRVGFRSAPSAGSEFWIEMPTKATPARSAPQDAASSSGPRLAGQQVALVLYVEDNPANVTFMKDLLGAFENVEVLTAANAEVGIELARQRRPNAIIMDINLPGMSGIDALGALRSAPETAHIPVIALTAAASERDRLRGERAGFFRYLTKPVRVSELEAALGAILSS